MLRVHRLPGSLLELLEEFRPCFTAPTFTTFALLAAGLITRPAGRTVCGMLAGAGLGGVWHHSRAHRFFAGARWSADAVGLVVLRLVTGWLIPAGAPLVIAVDDTLFRRAGRKVHAAYWGYDGSLKVPPGSKKLSRGNTFVVAAVIVALPFLHRPVALPVAARLWRRGGPAKTQLARELIGLIAAAPARRGRAVHVVADGAYICTELRALPAGVTLTGPMPRHASLYEVHPELDYPPARGRQRGRPRAKGAKIGTPAQLAAAAPGRAATVTRYAKTASVTIHERRCLWPGVFRSRPVRVIAVTEPGKALALVTTDMATPAEQVIARYASRWSIEVAFGDAKNITGAGEARNRRPAAVERTVPFALFTQSIVIIWYHLAGHSPAIARHRRDRAPWYATKTCPAYTDMIAKLRRVLIAAQFHPGVPRQPTPEEIRAVQLAWAEAAA
jgi:DDE superfamily endonuclease